MESIDCTEFDTELLTRVSILYYQEGWTQDHIAREHKISRIKVGRLLKKARDHGIVEINIRHHPVYSTNLEQQLQKAFGLKTALVAIDQSSEEKQRKQVARVVLKYLSDTLRDGDVVAVGQGRNIAAIAETNTFVHPRNVRFVSAIGGTHPAGDEINADHICRKLAKCFDGVSETLYAPAFVDSPKLVEQLKQNDTVKQALDRARKADVGIVGIGDLNENSHMVNLGWFSAQDLVNARREQGAVGDMMGYDFFRLDGSCVESSIKGRIIGLTTSELKQMPEVIGIASENSKVLATFGALQTGSITILATTVNNALALLSLAEKAL
ncbi:sugar-binding transcriptional regulator [Endozoicomonas gorgoniicola]|uniref:Sugar-binding transcriptional regulator n=1 Tax=Endozoicomonas gorgoniicola TaxID=1234144 RepID=A0ABT3N0U3_9GAMM|nr:sugar-binding transcriptional regulator [Endozoicomonas gorgoniicola]MCW7555252.1 sugar-binding transcriptional regulator [Endozoicomonas gorgoniicola]